MLFYLPLAISIFGAGHFVLFTEAHWKWKLLAFGLVGVSLGLQLLGVHFLIPLLIQAVVAIWMAIYWKLDR